MEGQEHYRNTGHIVRFFIWDARAVLPFAPLIVYKAWWLFFMGCATFVFFFVIEKKGLTFDNFLRKARCWITGNWKAVSTKLSRFLR